MIFIHGTKSAAVTGKLILVTAKYLAGSVHAKKSVRKFRKILSEYPKIFSSKDLRGLNSDLHAMTFGYSENRFRNFRTRVAAVITMRVLKFRNIYKRPF